MERTFGMTVEGGGEPGFEATGFHVTVESAGDAHHPAVFVLRGELDSLSSGHLAARLDRVGPSARGMVLDMSDVSFIDSSGLRTLIQARQMFADEPGVTLRKPQASTTRLLELTGLMNYFAIAP